MRRSSRLVMVVVLALTSIAPGSDNKKLREEEMNRQREGGYTLADFDFGSVYIADLTKKDRWTKEEQLPPPHDRVQDGLLSPDGALIALELNPIMAPNSLGIFHRDGSGLQEYKGFFRGVCWSADGESLIVQKERSLHSGFVLLNIRSGTVTELTLPSRAKITRQCWSPDRQKLIYYKMDHDPLRWTNPKVKRNRPTGERSTSMTLRKTTAGSSAVANIRHGHLTASGSPTGTAAATIAFTHREKIANSCSNTKNKSTWDRCCGRLILEQCCITTAALLCRRYGACAM